MNINEIFFLVLVTELFFMFWFRLWIILLINIIYLGTFLKPLLLLTLARFMPCGIAPEEAHEEGYVQKGWHHAIQLIGQPEIGKVDEAERCHNNSTEHTQRPVACLVVKRLRRVEQKGNHQGVEEQRSRILWNAQGLAEYVAEHAAGPNDAEHRGDFHDVLLGEMVAWIELKDEHMIHTRGTPAVDIDAPKEETFRDQKWRSEHAQANTPVLTEAIEHGRYDDGKQKHNKRARKEAHLECCPRTLLLAERRNAQTLHGACKTEYQNYKLYYNIKSYIRCLSPPSMSCVTACSVSCINLSMSLLV